MHHKMPSSNFAKSYVEEAENMWAIQWSGDSKLNVLANMHKNNSAHLSAHHKQEIRSWWFELMRPELCLSVFCDSLLLK